VKLKDQVAIVSGAGTGMGRAIAELFAAEGAKVVVNYRASEKEANEVVASIQAAGGEAMAHQADVSKDPEARAMVAAVEKAWGALHVLVNNAGWSQVTPHERLEDLTDEIWDRTMNTNVRGLFYATRAAVPLIRKSGGGSVINNASASAWHAQGSSIVYSASKAAVVNMTKSLARVLAPDIRVNALAPGLVHTRFAGWPDSTFEEGKKTSPLGRITSTEEVARVALFLAADATAITAETILVDAGRTQLGARRG
jgi:3-oxoacyl-[acyl-carrier protein] reductase